MLSGKPFFLLFVFLLGAIPCPALGPADAADDVYQAGFMTSEVVGTRTGCTRQRQLPGSGASLLPDGSVRGLVRLRRNVPIGPCGLDMLYQLMSLSR